MDELWQNGLRRRQFQRLGFSAGSPKIGGHSDATKNLSLPRTSIHCSPIGGGGIATLSDQ
jgi:hypothetical protein